MGYYVEMGIDLHQVSIKNQTNILKAINKMHEPKQVQRNGSGGCWTSGKQTNTWYAWVGNPGPEGFKTCKQALSEWRYQSTINKNKSLSIDYFDGEKWGDDAQLFAAIGPFLNGDIVCTGEDGEIWKYSFHDGKVFTSTGVVNFFEKHEI